MSVLLGVRTVRQQLGLFHLKIPFFNNTTTMSNTFPFSHNCSFVSVMCLKKSSFNQLDSRKFCIWLNKKVMQKVFFAWWWSGHFFAPLPPLFSVPGASPFKVLSLVWLLLPPLRLPFEALPPTGCVWEAVLRSGREAAWCSVWNMAFSSVGVTCSESDTLNAGGLPWLLSKGNPLNFCQSASSFRRSSCSFAASPILRVDRLAKSLRRLAKKSLPPQKTGIRKGVVTKVWHQWTLLTGLLHSCLMTDNLSYTIPG